MYCLIDCLLCSTVLDDATDTNNPKIDHTTRRCVFYAHR